MRELVLVIGNMKIGAKELHTFLLPDGHPAIVAKFEKDIIEGKRREESKAKADTRAVNKAMAKASEEKDTDFPEAQHWEVEHMEAFASHGVRVAPRYERCPICIATTPEGARFGWQIKVVQRVGAALMTST